MFIDVQMDTDLDLWQTSVSEICFCVIKVKAWNASSLRQILLGARPDTFI